MLKIVDADLTNWQDEPANNVLLAEPHPKYKTHVILNCFDPSYVHYLEDEIGSYSSVSIFQLEDFIEKVQDKGYEVWYLGDPEPIFSKLKSLEDPYPLPLNFTLYPFQVRGFNYVKDLKSSILNYSLGTGKSVVGTALANYLLKENIVDQVFVLCRNHNRTNWQRQLKLVADLDSEIADASGSAANRRQKRQDIYTNSQIVIANYEKMRLDVDFLTKALRKKRVLFILDEGAQALKTRTTQLYRATRRVLRACKESREIVLSGTPLENSPEDIYSITKLLDPKIFPSVDTFRNDYALTRNPFAPWRIKEWDRDKLQEMGMRIAHITHRADKYNDPEIAKQFPEEQWEDVFIDMSSEDRALYDMVTDKVMATFWQNNDLFSQFLVLQLLCNNPALLNISNAKLAREICDKLSPTDKTCAKLHVLKDMLNQTAGKVLIFSMYNELGSQVLHQYMKAWGYSSVLYGGTAKQKQEALDIFKADPDIKVFVSSDQGADSINLEEASAVIHYDQPYKWSTLLQRSNRINRITSKFDHISYYNLICNNTIEERKMEIVMRKKANMDAIFNEKSMPGFDGPSSWSKSSLWYMLTGDASYID